MRISDYMETELLTVRPEDSLSHAAETMLEHRVNGLPVVDENMKLVGKIDLTDLLPEFKFVPFSMVRALQLFGNWVDRHSVDDFADEYKKRHVREVMHQDVPYVTKDSQIEDGLYALEKKSKYRHLYIVEDGRILVGVMTRQNFLKVLLKGKG